MQTNVEYQQLAAVLEQFRALWTGGRNGILNDGVRYGSSHQGNADGADAVTRLLHRDFAGFDDIDLQFTNSVFRAKDADWIASAYVLGRGKQIGATVLFGGMVVLEGDIDREDTHIKLVRTQINWTNGDRSLLSHWKLPTEQRWQPGDAESTIVSELDAPLHRFQVSTLTLTDEQAIAEAYYTYAWGLDMADAALYQHCFTEEATAVLPPMGELRGRRSLTTTLKAFRMPWPWIQHYGTPLDIALDADGQTATLILGRIIPGEARTPEGEALYGAHYRINLERRANAWQIQRMEYLPGWIKVGGAP